MERSKLPSTKGPQTTKILTQSRSNQSLLGPVDMRGPSEHIMVQMDETLLSRTAWTARRMKPCLEACPWRCPSSLRWGERPFCNQRAYFAIREPTHSPSPLTWVLVWWAAPAGLWNQGSPACSQLHCAWPPSCWCPLLLQCGFQPSPARRSQNRPVLKPSEQPPGRNWCVCKITQLWSEAR